MLSDSGPEAAKPTVLSALLEVRGEGVTARAAYGEGGVATR